MLSEKFLAEKYIIDLYCIGLEFCEIIVLLLYLQILNQNYVNGNMTRFI